MSPSPGQVSCVGECTLLQTPLPQRKNPPDVLCYWVLPLGHRGALSRCRAHHWPGETQGFGLGSMGFSSSEGERESLFKELDN